VKTKFANPLRLDEDRILVEQLRLLLSNIASAAITTVALSILLVWTLSNETNAVALRTWGVALVSVKMLATFHARSTLASGILPRQAHPLVWKLIAFNVVDGVIWSSLAWVTLDNVTMAGSILVLATLAAMVGSAMSRLSAVFPIFIIFITTMMVCTSTKIFLLGDPAYEALGMASVIYLVSLLLMARNGSREIRAAIKLRFENSELVEQLRVETGLAKEARLEAESANAAKSRFLAAASHDLRQPLHAMSLFVAAMEDSARYPETRNMIGNVQRCTTALESLLQTLLDISKIDAGVIEPRPEHFRLAPLLERLGAEFTPQAQTAGLSLTFQCQDATVYSDPALVERILRNLIGNAIRYTPAGRIEVRAFAIGTGITVEVADTGIGIPADQQERVFEEFVQLGNPERDRTKGLGLGLAIVRRLADLLKLPITLASEPGKGSIFALALPPGNPDAAVERMAGTDAALNSLAGRQVAVIDDEADVRSGMHKLLEGWGCRVFAGEDARTVIALLAAEGVVPEVVLADYRLRGNTTGVAAIQALRDHFGTEIPAAIVTGDTAPERLAEARASGYLLLHKPLRPAKLRVLLQNLGRALEATA
jgi:signal transduction histidine kinase/CheY-like chemotaxis protein